MLCVTLIWALLLPNCVLIKCYKVTLEKRLYNIVKNWMVLKFDIFCTDTYVKFPECFYSLHFVSSLIEFISVCPIWFTQFSIVSFYCLESFAKTTRCDIDITRCQCHWCETRIKNMWRKHRNWLKWEIDSKHVGVL